MTVRQISCATHEARGLLPRRLETDRSRTPRKCHDFRPPVDRSHSVDDFVRVLGRCGCRIAGSSDEKHGAERLVVDPRTPGEDRNVEEVASERSPDQGDRLGGGELGHGEGLHLDRREVFSEWVTQPRASRGEHRHAVEEVDVQLEQSGEAVRADVTEPQVSHGVARALMGDVVAGGPCEGLELGKQVRTTRLSLLGVDGADEVEVDIHREARQVEMEEVERRGPTQQQLVAEPLIYLPEKLRESEDGLERSGAEAALAGDSREVSIVGESVHAASAGAERRCAGTMTFQRAATRPPRVPGSR